MVFVCYFIAFECMQIFIKRITYFSDFWNVFDLMRIVMLCIYIGAALNDESNTTQEGNVFLYYFLSTLNLLSWVRALSLLRLFTNTRILIHLIVEVVNDMVPFMIVLIGALIGFTTSYRALF